MTRLEVDPGAEARKELRRRMGRRSAMLARKNRLVGERFGRLTVVARYAGSYWNCRCDCGTERFVIGGDLTSGHTRSCGCLRQEKLKEPRGPLPEDVRRKILNSALDQPRGNNGRWTRI